MRCHAPLHDSVQVEKDANRGQRTATIARHPQATMTSPASTILLQLYNAYVRSPRITDRVQLFKCINGEWELTCDYDLNSGYQHLVVHREAPEAREYSS